VPAVAVRVRWYRGAWWVFAQSPNLPGTRGRVSRRIGPSEADRELAERRAVALRRQLGERDAIGPLLVGEAARDWIDTYGVAMKPTTRKTVEGSIAREIVPYLGKLDLRTLSDADLMGYVTRRTEDGLSVSSIRNALKIVRRVGNLAVRAGVLVRNPAAHVGELLGRVANARAAEDDRVASFTAGELAAILALAQQHEPRSSIALALLALTGMRKGEALGLRWEDVDFARRRIHVRRSRSMGELTTPKSGRGRFVPMARELERVLRAARIEKPFAEWVLTGRAWRKPMADVVLRRAWGRLRTDHFPKLGIQPLRLHDLRHTWATLALAAGRPLPWVAKVLGHADAGFTARVYAHALPEEVGDSLGWLDSHLVPSSGVRLIRESETKSDGDSRGWSGDPGWARTSDLELRRTAIGGAQRGADEGEST